MEEQVKFAICIPCYKCGNDEYIGALLKSIAKQKGDITVILCDDSPDGDNELYNYIEDNKEIYENKINVEYYKRDNDYKIHSPGNTRMDAVKHVKDDIDYILFADHDDVFLDDAFENLKEFIIENNYPEMVFTFFHTWSPDMKNRYKETNTGIVWTHGNAYKKSFIDKNKINYKKDMASHEDLYWNNYVTAHLHGQDKKYMVMDKEIYAWRDWENSLSRKFFHEKYYYIDIYFKDYIEALTEAQFECAKIYPDKKDSYLSHSVFSLLYMYFYYQAMEYRLGYEAKHENLDCIRQIIIKIKNTFSINENDIINIIYSNPVQYRIKKLEAINGAGDFIENTSFRDFILHL